MARGKEILYDYSTVHFLLGCKKRSTRNGQQQLFHLCWQMELSLGFLCEFNTLPLFTWAYYLFLWTVKGFACKAGLFCVIFFLEEWTASFAWTCVSSIFLYLPTFAISNACNFLIHSSQISEKEIPWLLNIKKDYWRYIETYQPSMEVLRVF